MKIGLKKYAMKQRIFQAELKIWYYVVTSISCLFLGALTIWSAFYVTTDKVLTLTITLAFFVGSIIGLLRLFMVPQKIKFYTDHLELSTFKGAETILFNEITAIIITNTDYKTTLSPSELFKIKTTNPKIYVLHRNLYEDSDQLKAHLKRIALEQGVLMVLETRNLPITNEQSIKREQNLSLAFKLFILGLGIYGMYYCYDQSLHYTIDKNNVVEVEVTLSEKPEIIKTALIMPIKEYPKVRFRISGVAYGACYNADFVKDTEAGEKIYLTLDKAEYQQKLVKFPKIYGIRTHKMDYLTIEDYISNNRSDIQVGVWAIPLILLYSYYEIRKASNNSEIS
jgi:hypothetical protein